jgi:hypothetical protein
MVASLTGKCIRLSELKRTSNALDLRAVVYEYTPWPP